MASIETYDMTIVFANSGDDWIELFELILELNLGSTGVSMDPSTYRDVSRSGQLAIQRRLAGRSRDRALDLLTDRVGEVIDQLQLGLQVDYIGCDQLVVA